MMAKNNNFEEIKVDSRDAFIDFIKSFRNDLNNNVSEWENANLNDFLEAIERYAEDIQGYYNNTGQLNEDANQASWKRFADILKGARIYE